MTRGNLINHLALHANMDHEILGEALAKLGLWQCSDCKSLLLLRKKCACNIRPAAEAPVVGREEMDIDADEGEGDAPEPGGDRAHRGSSLNGSMPPTLCPP